METHCWLMKITIIVIGQKTLKSWLKIQTWLPILVRDYMKQ
jgi:hypothetical protein